MFPYDYMAEFAAVARLGSLSKAALELSVSHSSLSRHMRTLETQLGVRLFSRTANGIELTPEGRYVANRAADIVGIADDVSYHTSKMRNVGRISVYGIMSFRDLRDEFRDAVARVGGKGGGLRLDVLPDEALAETSAAKMLETGEARIFVDFDNSGLFDAEDPEKFHREPLFEVGHVARVEPTHPLASKKEIRVADLDGAVLLHSDSYRNLSGYYWESIRHSLRDLGVRYTALTETLEQDTDWIGDYPQGIVVLTDNFDPLSLMRRAGKSIVPVHGIPQTMSAVC
ncbi:MAG: LysR family transcriptional regulator, partial [Coriobacteriales bacterium]